MQFNNAYKENKRNYSVLIPYTDYVEFSNA